MEPLLLIRYGEIGLKGGNRRFFEQTLVNRIREALSASGPVPTPGGEPFPGPDAPPAALGKVRRVHGRIYVEDVGDNAAEAEERLKRVFGIAAVHRAFRVEADLGAMAAAAVRVLDDEWGSPPPAAAPLSGGKDVHTFKIASRRADKSFPMTSMDLNRELGARVMRARGQLGLQVKMKDPTFTINVEVRHDGTYVYGGGSAGPGGLPVGVSGKVMALMSGGIDSPVAMWMLMKRGAVVHGVHFHSYPFTSERALEKVKDLTKILARWGGAMELFVVPFTDIQTEIQQHIPPDMGITIMRRMMFRIAEQLARKTGALALATGESVGQVASQTLESIDTIGAVTSMPVLRPLVGLDKSEIIARARDIGTYETSILPYPDCCSVFVAPRPRTKPRRSHAERVEARLDTVRLMEEAVAGTEQHEIAPAPAVFI